MSPKSPETSDPGHIIHQPVPKCLVRMPSSPGTCHQTGFVPATGQTGFVSSEQQSSIDSEHVDDGGASGGDSRKGRLG